MKLYRTTAFDTTRMPPGIPWIIGNEAAERFSFYGMRAILTVFMAQYLWLMDGAGGTPMADTTIKAHYHDFVAWVYFTPLLGALLSDVLLGKYRTIILLSLVYCAGHAALACMGSFGHSGWWLFAGLGLVCIGSGGIKPCVSAHVGDQFGPNNQNLLTRIYNWFYFSINLGSFISSMLTPWMLEWHGPHWAFGIPGVLMAIATLLFWMGRDKFVHIPPGGTRFFRELGSREGLVALAKLIPFFLFFVAFWALFDQTGSSWVLQAGQMNLELFGREWLASQIQAVNPILVLTFIPIFTFFIYPALNRVFKLTPLRKIGIGLFIMTAAFAVSTYSQSLIDAGGQPSIAWQLLAYALLTAAEVMVSIVGLEFAYTQSPKTMKSVIMSIFLLSIFGGNKLVSKLNQWIEIPSAAQQQFDAAAKQLAAGSGDAPRSIVLPGFDGIKGTDDDFIARLDAGSLERIELPAESTFENAAATIEELAAENGHAPPATGSVPDLGTDPWDNPLRYEILDADTMRIASNGPDRMARTRWDIGATIRIVRPQTADKASWFDRFRPAESWLVRRKAELGIAIDGAGASDTTYRLAFQSGGRSRLEGASYFRFFTWLMLGTAVAFVPFSILYKPRTYLAE